MPLRIADVRDQRAALRKILQFVEKGGEDENVRRVAQRIISACASKDDLCEAQAIFDAIKYGTDAVPFLKRGFKYVADPRSADFYVGAKRTLTELSQGGLNGGDCDDHTIIVGSLLASIGFKVGARAWGPDPSRDIYSHVYCIVAIPKKGPWPNGYTGHGMDTTVKQSSVGWEPPKKRALSMWLEEEA